jgi:polyisoprenoid-binding protein YceI
MRTIKSILFAITISTLSLQVNAQKKYTIARAAFEVAGTSTVHDWSMKSTEATGTAIITTTDSKLTDIKSLIITLAAESIKSSKTSMDEIAYETMDTKTHKTIRYVLKSADKINETTWDFTGTFTIAGISKDFRTQVRIIANENGNFTLRGSNRVTFGDFEMAPPTAALGVVRTGKELTILFNITLTDFAKNENILVIK